MLDAVLPTVSLGANDDWWAAAVAEFCRHVDDDIRRQHGGALPWERSVAVGQIDWWRVHAYTLDRLDELLQRMLPDGEAINRGNVWRGRHDAHTNWIEVSLLTGEWTDPRAGERGGDLVGLFAHVYGLRSRKAAIELGRWLSIEAVRDG